jgi:hypothetical protein
VLFEDPDEQGRRPAQLDVAADPVLAVVERQPDEGYPNRATADAVAMAAGSTDAESCGC